MKTASNIEALLSQNKKRLFEKYRLKSLGLFGSYSRNQQNVDSDIDILVDFEEPIGIEFIDLAEELEKLLNAKVDLVSKKGVKRKYLDQITLDVIYV